MSYLRFAAIWLGCVAFAVVALGGVTAYLGRAKSADGRLLGISMPLTSLLIAIALGSIAAVLLSRYFTGRPS